MFRFPRHFPIGFLRETQPGRYLPCALGDVFLVRVGILPVLQVDNRDQAWKERREELKFLKALKTDLIWTRSKVDTLVGYNRTCLKRFRLIDDPIEDELRRRQKD